MATKKLGTGARRFFSYLKNAPFRFVLRFHGLLPKVFLCPFLFSFSCDDAGPGNTWKYSSVYGQSVPCCSSMLLPLQPSISVFHALFAI
jgi:hypothetical protein